VDTPSKRNRGRELEARGIFYFFAGNPLKRPDSTKGIQGNARIFPLVSLAFALKQIACRLYLRG
jgi:hypothetical protein